MTVATVLWKRLDCPGHESARVEESGNGWKLSGVAAFTYSGNPCRLDYLIDCDTHWITRTCTVTGFIGDRVVTVEISRNTAGSWSMNGLSIDTLSGCADVDLGFSPVTNMLPVLRLALGVGASAPVRAAWLRFPELTMEVLDQTYTRLAVDRYHYSSANGAFQRDLTVDSSGFVIDYPGIWTAEGRTGELA